jgi:hypothetical protein
MEASIKKIEPNSGEKEAVVEQQKIPNEEVSVHSPRACQSKTAASRETTEADTEKTEPDRGMMQSIVEHQVAPKEDAIVKLVKGWKKRIEAGSQLQGNAESQRNLPEEIVDLVGSWLPPAGRCPAVQQWHGEKGTS